MYCVRYLFLQPFDRHSGRIERHGDFMLLATHVALGVWLVDDTRVQQLLALVRLRLEHNRAAILNAPAQNLNGFHDN